MRIRHGVNCPAGCTLLTTHLWVLADTENHVAFLDHILSRELVDDIANALVDMLHKGIGHFDIAAADHERHRGFRS